MAVKRDICSSKNLELPGKSKQNSQGNGIFLKYICEILLNTDSNILVLLTNDQDTIEILKAKHMIQSSSGMF